MTVNPFKVKKGLIVANNEMVVANNKVGIANDSPAYSLHITATDGVLVPTGNTGQRPTGASGVFRYNSEEGAFEAYIGGSWTKILSAADSLKVYNVSNTQVYP